MTQIKISQHLELLRDIISDCEIHGFTVDEAISILTEFKKMDFSQIQVSDITTVKIEPSITAEKIHAIKTVRQYTGMGLKESKDIVEQGLKFDIESIKLAAFMEDIKSCGYRGYFTIKKG